MISQNFDKKFIKKAEATSFKKDKAISVLRPTHSKIFSKFTTVDCELNIEDTISTGTKKLSLDPALAAIFDDSKYFVHVCHFSHVIFSTRTPVDSGHPTSVTR